MSTDATDRGAFGCIKELEEIEEMRPDDRGALLRILTFSRHRDEEVRMCAIEKLYEFPEESVRHRVIDALNDDEFLVRTNALEIIGDWGHASDLDMVLPFFDDESEIVRFAAIEAVGNLGVAKIAPRLVRLIGTSTEGECVRIHSALRKLDISDNWPLSQLLGLLESSKPNVRAAVVNSINDDLHIECELTLVEQHLRKALAIEDVAHVKTHIHDALTYVASQDIMNQAEFPTQESRANVIDALTHEEASIRSAALFTIGHLGSEIDIHLVKDFLNDPDQDVRLNAIDALANINKPYGLKFLREHISNASERERVNIFAAIRTIDGNDSNALHALLDLLGSKDHEVRNAVAEAFDNDTDLNENPWLVEQRLSRAHEMEKAGAAKRSLASALNYALASRIRESINSEEHDAYETIGAAIDHSDPRVRCSALFAFGLLGDRNDLEVIRNCLNDSEESVRCSAIEAIGDIGHPSALKLLERSLEHASELEQVAIHAAIRKIDHGNGSSLQDLLGLLDSTNEEVRIDVAESIDTDLGVEDSLREITDRLKRAIAAETSTSAMSSIEEALARMQQLEQSV